MLGSFYMKNDQEESVSLGGNLDINLNMSGNKKYKNKERIQKTKEE